MKTTNSRNTNQAAPPAPTRSKPVEILASRNKNNNHTGMCSLNVILLFISFITIYYILLFILNLLKNNVKGVICKHKAYDGLTF